MKKIIITSVLALLLSFEAKAEALLSIAAIVNDQVISKFDVEARMHLLISTSGLKNTPETRKRLMPQILNTLIDEKLKIQEMEKHNFDISKGEIENAISVVERQNKIPPGRLRMIVSKIGLEQRILEEQIKADVAWMKVVKKTMGRSIRVGEDEIQERLDEIIANKDKPKMLVSEIFLPVDDVSEDGMVYEAAKRLIEQLKAGASFRILARQFSQSATAARGGDLEWVFKGQLEEELDDALAKMNKGEISEPIRTLAGYYILQLRNKKEGGNSKEKITYTLSQLFIPEEQVIDGKYFDKDSLLEKINQSKGSCEKFNELAKEFKLPKSGAIGKLKQKDIPPVILASIKNLPLHTPSARVPMAMGKAVLMVCGKEKKSDIPSKEKIEKSITNERLEMLARRRLRELRRAAVIDIRQ